MQRVFRRHFDIGRNGKVPTRQTILNWITQFRTTASVVKSLFEVLRVKCKAIEWRRAER
jgi:hypothetical protein